MDKYFFQLYPVGKFFSHDDLDPDQNSDRAGSCAVGGNKAPVSSPGAFAGHLHKATLSPDIECRDAKEFCFFFPSRLYPRRPNSLIGAQLSTTLI